MSSRGYPKRSARAAGITTYSTSRRQRRGAASERGVVVSTENLGVPAVAWTKVLRHPSAPLDEPYFGRRPKASFKVPMWVRVDELTEEEKAKYDEVEKKREEQRALWKKEMEKKREEADKESAQSKEVNQTEGETNEGAQEALTKIESQITSAAEPQTENVGEQNQEESTQQTIMADGATAGAEISVQTPAATTISNELSSGQHTEGGEPK